jgi:membrane-associated phospholipid phosphatase
MKRIVDKLSNIIPEVCHPLLMTTYGFLIALNFTYLAVYPTLLKVYLVTGVMLCTTFIPGIIIVLMVRSGLAHDLGLNDRRERVVPYLFFIAGEMICLFFLYKMQMPTWVLSIFAAVCVALFITLCINFVWKISAHAIGVGGLLGAIMGVSYIQLMNPYWLFVGVILMAGLVCTSRILLGKHTPMQVYAGFGLGFLCTFGASFINIINLFIK